MVMVRATGRHTVSTRVKVKFRVVPRLDLELWLD
jgi:hypothetical protein